MNAVKETLERGGFVQGVYLSIPSEDLAELFSRIGYDFVVADLEHGNIDPQTLTNIFRAVRNGTSLCFARLSTKTAAEIQRVLDLGAEGLHVPDVTSKAEIEHIIACTRFVPDGMRGAAFTTRSGQFGLLDPSEQVDIAREEILIVATIESRQGVDNLEEILTVPSVDVVNIGLTDLCQSYGYASKNDQGFRELVTYIARRTRERGKALGGTISNREGIQAQVENGARYFKIPTSTRVITEAFRGSFQMTHAVFKSNGGV